MIVERRERILRQRVESAADLYRVYTDEFFRKPTAGVLDRGMKEHVLELLALALARAAVEGPGGKEPVKVSEGELREAAARAFRTVPDAEITGFVAHEMRTYSLLVCETFWSLGVYSFGHRSFQEFFLARALVRLLEECGGDAGARLDDLAALCRLVSRSADLRGFVVGLLRGSPTAHRLPGLLRQPARAAFGGYTEDAGRARAALLGVWVEYCRVVLAGPRPDLAHFRLERLTLVDADLSGCDLRGADLSGARLARCDLRGADLSESRCRGAVFERCRLEGAAFAGADLEGALGVETAAAGGMER
jgi:hypothetical protein